MAEKRAADAGFLEWASIGLSVALASIAGAGALGAASALSPSHDPQEIVSSVERLLAAQRLVLFPLGVATAIAALVVLLRHSRLFSWRGRLQALAVLVLFVSAVVSSGAIDPVARAVTAAAAGGGTDLPPLLARLVTYVRLAFACTLVATVSLAIAHRMPLPPELPGVMALDSRQRSLLFLLGAATLFEGYDRFIGSLALPYIGADLGASEGTLGFALSAIRLGALASIPLGWVADRHGRRRLLLFTVLAYTVATAATGLSRGVVTFVVFQLIATIFLTAELAVAQVIISEEFPAKFRARGQGFLGAFAALGAGVAALLFPILQATPLGWRGLYFIGILPLLLIAYMRRSLPETERWQRAHTAGETRHLAFSELLAPAYRLRLVVLIAVSIAAYAAASPAFAFASWRVTRDFGWTPSQVSTMVILGGGVGMLGWFVFGSLAERFGRRPVGIVALVGCGGAIFAYFQSAWPGPAFGALVFMEAGAAVAVNALGTELFPTRMRSTAKSWIINASIVGALLGLFVVGAVAGHLGGADRVLALLSILPAAVSPALLLLPETSGRELEELA